MYVVTTTIKSMTYSISQWPVDSFSASRWRSFDLFTRFNFECKRRGILSNCNIIQEYAVGYCPGESLFCRPKTYCTEVMFLIDEEYQLCHLKNFVFDTIFKTN